MKKFLEFIKDMLSGGDKTSSKRFWGSILMLSAVILSYMSILGKCDDIAPNKLQLVDSMYLFGSVCLGLGIFDGLKGYFNKNKDGSN